MKGTSEKTAVHMVVGFILAIAAISVATGSINNLITQGSSTAQTDELGRVADELRSKCSDLNSDNPLNSDVNMEVKLNTDVQLFFDDGRMELESSSGDNSKSWDVPDECSYGFTGSSVNGGTLETGDTTIWRFGITGDVSSNGIRVNVCRPGELEGDETCA